jgi:mannitol/fructose-specific phosphotransferase system IIA component (Ntr-type)
MKITDIININSIKVGISLESKEELLRKLVNLAAASGNILDKKTCLSEVIERESIMSTGVGKGIALPHAKTNAIKGTIGAFCTLKEPLDYNSLDGKPIRIAFLLLGEENNVGSHLRLLSMISRLMNIEAFREKLLDSKTPQDAFNCFYEYEMKDL